jgi:hypothetical protein
MSACQWPLETWKSSFRLWCSSHGQILPRIVPVSFFLTAAPDRGKTSLVRPREWSYSDFIYFPHLYIHTYCSSVLQYFDGANYLVVDGANSLWQRASMIMSWVIKQLSWGIPSTCASTISTDASSEPWKTIGFIENHHAEIDRKCWVLGRTITAITIATRILLPWLLGNTTPIVHWDDKPAWS